MVKLSNFLLTGAAAMGVVGFPSLASAQTAFSDFSSSNSGLGYNTSSQGYSIQGSGVNGGYAAVGFQFTSLNSGYLSDVVIPISYLSSQGNVDVRLMADNGSNAPGSTVLDSWVMQTDGHYVANSYLTPTTLAGNSAYLTASSNYWLEVLPDSAAGSDHFGWYFNNLSGGIVGREADSTNGTSWNAHNGLTLGAFRVDLQPSATPEPVTLSLGIAGIGFAIRRARKARRS